VRKSIGLLGYVAALVVLASIFSDKLGGRTIALGVAGAGVAFALQEVIASVAGWLAISIGGVFKAGDRIQLGGITGDAIDIGILRTTLMECGQWVRGDLYSGRVVRIANSFVFKQPVFNYSGDFPFLWDEIQVPVKYGSDYERAQSILARIANETLGDCARGARTAWEDLVKRFSIESAQVEPMVTRIANDNWVEFTVRYIVDYKKRRSTKDVLFTKILREFDATDGRVSMASATFQLVEIPALDVRVRS
jgi:small-conductance mechanosensitive channel